MFLMFFECRGATSEVVVYRDNLGAVQAAKDRVNTITGCTLCLKPLVARYYHEVLCVVFKFLFLVFSFLGSSKQNRDSCF